MSSYGWTLNQTLDLTYPQIKTLFRALMKWPTANIVVGALVQHMNADKDDVGVLEKMKAGSVSKVDGAAFLKRFGIKPETEV
jgi:hypothetical protein